MFSRAKKASLLSAFDERKTIVSPIWLGFISERIFRELDVPGAKSIPLMNLSVSSLGTTLTGATSCDSVWLVAMDSLWRRLVAVPEVAADAHPCSIMVAVKRIRNVLLGFILLRQQINEL